MTAFSPALGLFVVLLPVSVPADTPPANCKPLTYMGVRGCELLPDRTCPKGYHVEAVGPANPQMKAPSRLMCVADKPAPDKTKKAGHADSAAKPPRNGVID